MLSTRARLTGAGSSWAGSGKRRCEGCCSPSAPPTLLLPRLRRCNRPFSHHAARHDRHRAVRRAGGGHRLSRSAPRSTPCPPRCLSCTAPPCRYPPVPQFPPIAFYSAVRLGDPEQLAKIMDTDPYFITQDNGAGAPIHFATTYKQLDMVGLRWGGADRRSKGTAAQWSKWRRCCGAVAARQSPSCAAHPPHKHHSPGILSAASAVRSTTC